MSTRVLIIDDDRSLCDLLAEYLASSGFSVEAAHDADTGLRRALVGDAAMVILDVMLPGGASGFDVLRAIRAKSKIPVLMLTARGEEIDRIVGLEIGADDYLPKPFNPRELAARLNAILRRQIVGASDVARTAQAPIQIDDVSLDCATRVVRQGDRRIELTGTEFALLEVLLRSAGTVLGRDALSEQVLGRPLEPFDRSIDMHVSHLRRKLGPGADQSERIRGVRGIGYVYVRASADEAVPSDATG